MPSPLVVNPFRCRMWEKHDRLEGHISAETCRAEIDSFLRHGQLVPAIGRPISNDPQYDVELICGARRLFVARHLNKPLLVELRDMTDREAIIAIDIENRQRSDVSPYERGLSYTRWLRAGFFRSQDEIARGLKVSPSQVSRLLRVARLPSVILNAFDSPTNICEGWGLDLLDALDDPARREQTLRVARALGNRVPRGSARDVYRELMSASARGRKLRPRLRDEVVKDNSGYSVFRIRRQTKLVAFLVPSERVSADVMDSLRKALTEVLAGAPSCAPASEDHFVQKHLACSRADIEQSVKT